MATHTRGTRNRAAFLWAAFFSANSAVFFMGQLVHLNANAHPVRGTANLKADI